MYGPTGARWEPSALYDLLKSLLKYDVCAEMSLSPLFYVQSPLFAIGASRKSMALLLHSTTS
jgi:hypothetical protein